MNTNSTALERALQEQLLSLNFHACLRAIAQLLERMGYLDVQLSDRTNWVGRHTDAGFDLTALLPVAIGRRRIIVQVKQYDSSRRVFRRSVDELRGVMLRTAAAEAILVTTGFYSKSLDRSRYASTAIAPVRLIDLSDLTQLMRRYAVGLLPPLVTADELITHQIDRPFFASLERRFGGNSRATAADTVQLTLSLVSKPRTRKTSTSALRRSLVRDTTLL